MNPEIEVWETKVRVVRFERHEKEKSTKEMPPGA